MSRRRPPRALAVAAAALAVAALLPAAGAAGRTPACATRGLVVWLDTRAGAAAGSRYYELAFTNLSGRACVLRGYPGVSAVDLRGRPLGGAASRNPARPRRAVRLPRGATATAVLQVANAQNFPRADCRPVTAAGFRVFPPGRRAAKVVPFPFLACSRRGPVFLTVQPVRRR